MSGEKAELDKDEDLGEGTSGSGCAFARCGSCHQASAQWRTDCRTSDVGHWFAMTCWGRLVADSPKLCLHRQLAAQGRTDCHTSDVGHWFAMTRGGGWLRIRPSYACIGKWPRRGGTDCRTSDVGHWFAMTWWGRLVADSPGGGVVEIASRGRLIAVPTAGRGIGASKETLWKREGKDPQTVDKLMRQSIDTHGGL